jgi:hypothetical protein
MPPAGPDLGRTNSWRAWAVLDGKGAYVFYQAGPNAGPVTLSEGKGGPA